jgi:hypothetical protein
MESARFKIDMLICQHCGGFRGEEVGDKDRSCICLNHAHIMKVRQAARLRQRKLAGRP